MKVPPSSVTVSKTWSAAEALRRGCRGHADNRSSTSSSRLLRHHEREVIELRFGLGRRRRAHPRGAGAQVRRQSRAHPADRGQGTAQAEEPGTTPGSSERTSNSPVGPIQRQGLHRSSTGRQAILSSTACSSPTATWATARACWPTCRSRRPRPARTCCPAPGSSSVRTGTRTGVGGRGPCLGAATTYNLLNE